MIYAYKICSVLNYSAGSLLLNLVTCKISEGDFRLMNALRFLFLYIHKLHHS